MVATFLLLPMPWAWWKPIARLVSPHRRLGPGAGRDVWGQMP
jgi:hypothetical protein